MNFETKMFKIAKEAILKHRDAKKLARVNHEDNFALFMFREGHDAAMDEVIRLINDWNLIEWFNKATEKKFGTRYSDFDKMVMRAGREAYQQLRKL